MIRLTGGSLRGRLIKAPPGGATRPTGAKVREALFNILQGEVDAARFADICCGAGTVGLEALSRGAAHVTFVESSRRALALLEANLALLHIAPERVTVCPGPAERWATARAGEHDVVYCDPPYDTALLPSLLPALAQRGRVRRWLVAETRKTTGLSALTLPGLAPQPVRRYGDTALWLWRRADDPLAEDL